MELDFVQRVRDSLASYLSRIIRAEFMLISRFMIETGRQITKRPISLRLFRLTRMCRESTKDFDFALSRPAWSTDRARAQSAIRSFKHSGERLVDYGNTRRDISKNSILGKVRLFCELVILIPHAIYSVSRI